MTDPKFEKSLRRGIFVSSFTCKKVMSIAEEEREGQGSNKPTRKQCLLDVTGSFYKLAAEKACHRWSFILKGDRTGRSISEFKNYLTVNHGLHDVSRCC